MAEIIFANVQFDDEWVELIMRARNLGISVEEIRQFLLKMKDDQLVLANHHLL